MTKRVGGIRRKTRNIFSKTIRQKGKISISKYLQQYKVGDRVILKAEPAIQKGLYHHRHHGRQGIVQGKRGSCYEVLIKDMGKQKKIISHPVHLKKA
ncbi:50S ribosomal protein L21e [Candidatus Woesearchaeota archaeon CG10_big_fil_rev_8_21_14_0_10_44_13]|nr:MAG: 50S ribosomal protein L21e [Candidatus Woesearchaeota archaeon CG10_big_fil_rev_8_21_14_0_10_44_13]